MSAAADAHLTGDQRIASECFHRANIPELWDWLYPAWEKCHLNVLEKKPVGDTRIVPNASRDPQRRLNSAQKARVLARDGFRCRYCGIPVIRKAIRDIAVRHYPEAVPWDRANPRERHMGFQALWLQFDHVVPHCHGGASDEENSVISCSLCNFGKDQYTLRQLNLEDPRAREPVPVAWDGLERMRTEATKNKHTTATRSTHLARREKIVTQGNGERRQSYFFPRAWISAGYFYTMPINGKQRWFKLSPSVEAEPVMRSGVSGCRLVCSPQLLTRRGLSPEAHIDSAD